jgi:hypothetical protein
VHCSAQFCAQVWRRVVGATVVASSYVFASNISWIGFGLSDHILLVRYPWGKVCYPLFGYLAYSLLPECFSIKVKVLGGWLQPLVG